MEKETRTRMIDVYTKLCQMGHFDLADRLLNETIKKDGLTQDEIDAYLEAARIKRGVINE